MDRSMNPRITSLMGRAKAVLRRVIAGGAALALVAACSSGESSTSADADGETGYAAALQTSLAQVVKETTVPSAIVVVRSGQFGDATFTFGTTELGGTEPVTTNDHGRVGSVTKTMTATIILQLVQEGRLALDDPVSKYVASVPDGDNITIAQLLDMRSGLYSYTDDPEWAAGQRCRTQRVWTPQELLDIAFAHPADFAPGSNWHYTNTNYILLGMIMEQLTGQTASELFEQRLFTPLGMDDTVLPALEDVVDAGAVRARLPLRQLRAKRSRPSNRRRRRPARCSRRTSARPTRHGAGPPVR